MKGKYCDVPGFVPGKDTLEAIEEMNRVTDMSALLSKALYATPFYSIFVGRGTYKAVEMGSMAYNLQDYDFKMFSDAVKGVGLIKQRRLENIANRMQTLSTGKESEFWRCVYNAL
ncbi:hypothetical protein F0225_19180 [Vibrio pectenicida]|uniref:Uncharacterized protein n=1 Tax=Vibrio pectenicida TaxID=62763 RepID=A0A7Y4A2D8_9VIBR|nr:hypothetical protein [Vibrio pectenicida]NOH73436.1 hypothetical protein [Vibrio pectenicida]